MAERTSAIRRRIERACRGRAIVAAVRGEFLTLHAGLPTDMQHDGSRMLRDKLAVLLVDLEALLNALDAKAN